MGKIICEKHGDQGIVLTCEHIRQDILSATTTIKCVVTAIHEIEKFGNVPVNVSLGYCDTCAKHHGLPLVDRVAPDPPGEFAQFPVCGECFRVFKESLSSCESA
jgi:hypothetical protein